MADSFEPKRSLADPSQETPGMMNSYSGNNSQVSPNTFEQRKEPVAREEHTIGQYDDAWFASLKKDPEEATFGLDDPIYDFPINHTEQAHPQSNFGQSESTSYNNSHRQSAKRGRDVFGLDDPDYDYDESSSRPTKQARYSYDFDQSESFYNPPSPPPTSPTKNVQHEAVVNEQYSEYNATSPPPQPQPTREHDSDFDSYYDATPPPGRKPIPEDVSDFDSDYKATLQPGKQSIPEHDSDWDSDYDATPRPRKQQQQQQKTRKTTKVRGNESRNTASRKTTKSETKTTKNQTKKKGNRMLAELAAANKPGRRELEDLQKDFGSHRGNTKRSREDDDEDDMSIKPVVKKHKTEGSFFEPQSSPEPTSENGNIIEYRSRRGAAPQFFDVGDMGVTQKYFDEYDAGMKADLVRMLPRVDGPRRKPAARNTTGGKTILLLSSDDEEDDSSSGSQTESEDLDNEKEDGNNDVGPSNSNSDSDDDFFSKPTFSGKTPRKTYTGGKTARKEPLASANTSSPAGKSPRKTYTGGKTLLEEPYEATSSRASSPATSHSSEANAARNRRCKGSVTDDDNGDYSDFKDDDDDSDDDDAFLPPSTGEPVSRAAPRNTSNARTSLPSSRSTSTSASQKGSSRNNKKSRARASVTANTNTKSKPHGNTGQTKNRAWDNNSQEANILNRYIQDRRALEAQNPQLPKLKDMKLYEGAAAELRNHGITHRTANACKLYWGRAGRQYFQFEERENASNPLGATSTQGPARTQQASTSSRKTPAQTQTQTQAQDQDQDQDQSPAPAPIQDPASNYAPATPQMYSYSPAPTPTPEPVPVPSSPPTQMQAAPQTPPQSATAQQMNAQQQAQTEFYNDWEDLAEWDEDDAPDPSGSFYDFLWLCGSIPEH